MNVFIPLIMGICVFFIGKITYKKNFNPVSVYALIWTVMIVFYNLRLLKFTPLLTNTWIVIFVGSFSFVMGNLISYYTTNSDGFKEESPLLKNNAKIINRIILITGLIGLFGALQSWYVLFSKFHSIAQILIQANTVYRMRVEGELEGMIPYLQVFTMISLTFAGFFTAYKNRFSLISLIPLTAGILKSLANFGRIGMLLTIVHFVCSYLLAKYYFFNTGHVTKISKNIKVYVVILLVLVISSAAVVKTFRGTFEKYKGASKELLQLRNNPFFSPSVYLYLSSHIGVLNSVLFYDSEKAMLGENTFAAVYNFTSKFGLNEPIPFDLRGYYIPMWTNTGTYLRDFYVDYGIGGVTLAPFILGILTSFFWRKFYGSGRIKYFILLTYFFSIIVISFFSSITRGGDWSLSLLILLLSTPVLEKYVENKDKKLLNE